MANLTITAASVVAGAGAAIVDAIAAATITAGQALYRDETTGVVGLADGDSGTSQVRAVYGIALNGGAAGQPIRVQRSGPVTIGATLVAGTVYALSRTPGAIAPVADLTTGDYPTVIGMATSTTVLAINIQAAGVWMLVAR